MDIGLTKKVENLKNEVRDFIDNEIRPKEDEYFQDVGAAGSRFKFTSKMLSIINILKQNAKSKNLWNFWLTDSIDGHGLTTVEYAYLAEEMGKCRLGAEIFNCSAPDTGNMEVIKRYGSQKHKEIWLKPVLYSFS